MKADNEVYTEQRQTPFTVTELNKEVIDMKKKLVKCEKDKFFKKLEYYKYKISDQHTLTGMFTIMKNLCTTE